MIAKYLKPSVQGQKFIEYARNLAVYMIAPSDIDSNEKCIAVQAHNLVTQTDFALNSKQESKTVAQNIAREFDLVASRKPRIKAPGAHWILSWQPSEKPNVDTIFSAAKDFCEKMGFDLNNENQALFAIHDDKKHIHVHIFVNKVGFSEKVVNMGNGWYKNAAQKAIVEISNKYYFLQVPKIMNKFKIVNSEALCINKNKEVIPYPLQKSKELKIDRDDIAFMIKSGYKSEKQKLKEALLKVLPSLQKNKNMGIDKFKRLLSNHNIEVFEKGTSGISYSLLNNDKVFAASDLGSSVTRKDLKDVLLVKAEPKNFANNTEELQEKLSSIIENTQLKSGWPLFHQKLSEIGVLADKKHYHELVFTLANDFKVSSNDSKLVNTCSLKNIEQAIGTTWRSRPKDIIIDKALNDDHMSLASKNPNNQQKAIVRLRFTHIDSFMHVCNMHKNEIINFCKIKNLEVVSSKLANSIASRLRVTQYSKPDAIKTLIAGGFDERMSAKAVEYAYGNKGDNNYQKMLEHKESLYKKEDKAAKRTNIETNLSMRVDQIIQTVTYLYDYSDEIVSVTKSETPVRESFLQTMMRNQFSSRSHTHHALNYFRVKTNDNVQQSVPSVRVQETSKSKQISKIITPK